MRKHITKLLLVSSLLLPILSYGSAEEKSQATSEQVTGSIQSSAGSLIGNKKMEFEGKNKKLKGDLRSTKEDIKDKFK